jgi:non-specific serine/threonine protein kinase
MMPSSRFDEVRDYGFADQALALRQRAGLTQRDLGALLGVSERTIGAWETGLSYPGVMHLRQLIALYMESGAFEAEQEEDQAATLWEAVRVHAPRRTVPFDRRWFIALRGGTAPSGPEGTHLPPARTSFVGRAADLAVLTPALDPATRTGGRLLTLSGVAGCGKTRLALALAAALSDAYADGAWCVELAPLAPSASGDATAVAMATLSALGLHEQPEQDPLDTLVARLRTMRLLLVLDNCEHVVAACAALAARLLSACPHLQILTTSQQALRLADETVWRVSPLAVPPQPPAAPTTEDLWQLWQTDAVQLFVDRAQTIQPSFALDAQTAAAVVGICQRLDGLPLAIELAASRLHVLPVGEILARLGDRFRLLRRGGRTAVDRHHTLEATLDWSYGLLEPAEQALLRRLAVFAGGWEVAAAEAVCAGEGVAVEAVLALLDELLERSLVYVHVADGIPRYGMLETVRHYGLLQLAHAGEMAVVQDRHLDWCMALAEQAVSSLQGAEQAVRLAQLEREYDNLRAALRWSLGAGACGTAALRLAGALARFWLMHAHFSEGRHWLGAALAAEDGTAMERARALDGAGLLAEGQGAYEEATRLLEESLALWREVGDRAGLARALSNLGRVVEGQRKDARARALLEEALAIFIELNARGDIAGTRAALGFVAEFQGDYETAWSLLEQGLSQFRSLGDEWGIAHTLGNMAITARRHGQYDRALAFYEEALTRARSIGDRRGIIRGLNGLALSLASLGEYDRAQGLLTECLALSRTIQDLRSTAASLNDLGEVACKQGAHDRARGHFEESLSLLRQFGDSWGIANAYRNLAGVATEAGDQERAADLLLQSVALFQALSDRWGIAQCLELGGRVAAARERCAETVQLLAGAEALRETIGTRLEPDELAAHEHLVWATGTALGEARCTDLWTSGRTLPPGDLLALFATAIGTDPPAETGEGRLSHAEPHPRPTTWDPTPASSPPRPPTNLAPARTSFVGRTRDLERLLAALDPMARTATRLLTLSGVPGSGKTRLALAVADRVLSGYRDGVWLVELAPTPAGADANPTPVAAATLAALGLHEQPGQALLDTLVEHLQPWRVLLVLDNCEHVVAACAALTARILAACPDVQILATSQQPLGTADETVWPVAPLGVPPVEGAPAPEALVLLGTCEAMQLFLERARAVQPGFVLSAENAPTVAAICRRLDGLPLAIELAAARLNVLPVEEILARLDDRFRLLRRGGRSAAGRHQALQATLDWSYALLGPAEQAVLRRLAVFVGGWDLAAAEAVCAGEVVEAAAVLALLDELLDRSLVYVSDAAGVPRYGMLETVRQYGLQQLERAGETVLLRDRHLAWCAMVAERAAPALLGAEQIAWLARLDRDHDNLRAALQWALERNRSTLGLRVAAGLCKFWRSHGHLREGQRWFAALLASAAEDEDATSMALRASALEGAGWLAQDGQDFAQAAALFAQSGALRRALGQEERPAGPLITAGLEARSGGDYARATVLFEESLAQQRRSAQRARTMDDDLGLTRSWGDRYTLLALVLREQGAYARASALYEECLALHRDLGDRQGMASARLGLGDIARDQGDAARVRSYCEECLLVFREYGLKWAIGFSLNNLALAALMAGDLALAARQAEESEAIFRELVAGPGLAEVLVTVGRVRGARGETAAARASLAEALALAWAKGPRWVVAAALEGIGVLEVRQGQAQHGVHLLAAAAALRQAMGAPVRPADRRALEDALAAARTALASAAFAEAWTTGQTLSAEQIVARASVAPEKGPATPDRDSAPHNVRTGV